MRMALTYADAAGAEPDAVKRSELLDLCMTCWRQAPRNRSSAAIGAHAPEGATVAKTPYV